MWFMWFMVPPASAVNASQSVCFPPVLPLRTSRTLREPFRGGPRFVAAVGRRHLGGELCSLSIYGPDEAGPSPETLVLPSDAPQCSCPEIPPSPSLCPLCVLCGYPFPPLSAPLLTILSILSDFPPAFLPPSFLFQRGWKPHLRNVRPASFPPLCGSVSPRLCVNPPYPRESSQSVTGPSLTSSTSISAWNTPVSTRTPLSRSSSTNRSNIPFAASGRIARM